MAMDLQDNVKGCMCMTGPVNELWLKPPLGHLKLNVDEEFSDG